MNGFYAANVALEIAAKVRPLHEVVRRRDAELADQIYRATKSLVLAVPEGGRRAGKDRAYHFRIAAGSAAELASVFITVSRSNAERLMTLSTSAVAVCCCSDSLRSLVRASTSLNSRVFSIAITA